MMRTKVTHQESPQLRVPDAPAAVTLARRSQAAQLQLKALIDNSPRQLAASERQQQVAGGTAGHRASGLPAPLKSGIEALSGMAMDGVTVHYNSAQPARLGAHAYAQGTEIHLAAGQEKHLPHEAWHVVQQAQGRVRPTMQMKQGVAINDDEALELEADVMGAKAAAMTDSAATTLQRFSPGAVVPAQCISLNAKRLKALKNWVPENHEPEMEAIKQWFIDATGLDESGFDAIVGNAFKTWYDDEAKGFFADPPTKGAASAAPSSAPKETKVEDPLDAVRGKLKAAKLKPGDFTEDELKAILAGKESAGWDAAIQNVNQQRLARLQSAALEQDRTEKYAAAKAAGDLVFTGGLIRDVWNLSYAIAISGNAGANTTLSGAQPDGVINTAAAAWHHRGNILPLAGAATPKSLATTNFHVPGAPVYIEDKSTRPVNPDPSRGRQADFICHWGLTSVNVHVDSTVPH